MKVNIGAIARVLLALYKAVLSGKTVTVGGTQVTLPSEGPAVFPAGRSPLDRKPSEFRPPIIVGPR